MNPVRIMIAGTGSGAGKTTVSLGLMTALARRGLAVRPFKVGPDYIDPGLHRAACGEVSHNLDAWLMPESALLDLFLRRASAQSRGQNRGQSQDRSRGLALIEGVMGLFDGLNGGAFASSAHVAALLRTPVVLVINAEGMSLSAAAVAAGFAAFRPLAAPGGPDLSGLRVAGVILNRVSGKRHAELLRRAVEEHGGLPCLGCLPRGAAPALPERHLGLVPAAEQPLLTQTLDQLARSVEEHINIPLLLRLAGEAPALRRSAPPQTAPADAVSQCRNQAPAAFAPRIGLARDAAFSFYYEDSLDQLTELGAELVPFSPLQDKRLPGGLHGLYLGGGFPEVFAEELEANAPLRASLRAALQKGLPAYAECGGMLYLCRSLQGEYGPPRAMAGFFPQRAVMTRSLQPFGYVTLSLRRDGPLGPAGQRLRAHEFHYSRLESGPDEDLCGASGGREVMDAARPGNGRAWSGGLFRANTLAWYPHLHFRGCPRAAASFVENFAAFARNERPPQAFAERPGQGRAAQGAEKDIEKGAAGTGSAGREQA